MRPIHFEGAQIIGKPKNWDDAKDGQCIGLPAMVGVLPNGMKSFTSVWKPSDEERIAISLGANIALSSFGVQTPVTLSAADIDGPIVPFADDISSETA